jgi:hypothetical protein
MIAPLLATAPFRRGGLRDRNGRATRHPRHISIASGDATSLGCDGLASRMLQCNIYTNATEIPQRILSIDLGSCELVPQQPDPKCEVGTVLDPETVCYLDCGCW